MHQSIALITGASRGIGAAIAKRLAETNYVILNYNSSKTDAENVLESIRLNGGSGMLVKGDVSSYAQMEQLFAQINSLFERLDVLVNCGGIMHDALVEELELSDWDKVLNINLKGVFICCKLAIPLLRRSKAGRIINISSQAAFTGSSSHAHYAASKAGVLGFSYSLAKEVGKDGITVNVVSPGRIKTAMVIMRQNGREKEWINNTPLGRLGYPEEVASLVAYLASSEASYITGANFNVNGGLVMG